MSEFKCNISEKFFASNYLVKIPVTYFQGQNDSAMKASVAVQHFQSVPLGQKQMLVLAEGGHNPNLQILGSDSPDEQLISEKALNGDLIPQDLLSQVNKSEGVLK